MISLLVSILVLLIIGGLIYWVLGMLPLPAPVMQIAKVVLAVILILILVGMLFGGVPMPHLNLRN